MRIIRKLVSTLVDIATYITDSPEAILKAGQAKTREDYLHGLWQGCMFGTPEHKANSEQALRETGDIYDLWRELVALNSQWVVVTALEIADRSLLPDVHDVERAIAHQQERIRTALDHVDPKPPFEAELRKWLE